MAKKIDTTTLAVGAVAVAAVAAFALPKLAQAGGSSGGSNSGTPGITEGVYSGPRTYTVDGSGNAGVSGGGKGPKITGEDVEKGMDIAERVWSWVCPNGCKKNKDKDDVSGTDEDGRI